MRIRKKRYSGCGGCKRRGGGGGGGDGGMSACIVFRQSFAGRGGNFILWSQWRCFEKAEDECNSDLHLLVGTKHEEILIKEDRLKLSSYSHLI